jgi:methionyl aminopeptidase
MRLKTKQEISKMFITGAILADVLKIMKESAVPGITTLEIDAIGESYVKSCGAVAALKGFKPRFSDHVYQHATCISVNNQIIHAPPSDYTIKKGDIVTLDMAISKADWYADAAITIVVEDNDSDEYKESKILSEYTHLALLSTIEKIMSGDIKKTSDIGKHIQKMADEKNFGVVSAACGHSIGQELHEPGIQILNSYEEGDSGVNIVPGMTFCIEPIFTMGSGDITKDKLDPWTIYTSDGSHSAHWEHTVAITENGPLTLTL